MASGRAGLARPSLSAALLESAEDARGPARQQEQEETSRRRDRKATRRGYVANGDRTDDA